MNREKYVETQTEKTQRIRKFLWQFEAPMEHQPDHLSSKVKVLTTLLYAERWPANIVAGEEFIMEKKGILWMKKNKIVRQHGQMFSMTLEYFLKYR